MVICSLHQGFSLSVPEKVICHRSWREYQQNMLHHYQLYLLWYGKIHYTKDLPLSVCHLAMHIRISDFLVSLIFTVWQNQICVSHFIFVGTDVMFLCGYR